MKLDIYQVDAFTRHVFAGNPAAVCPLERWLSDSLMQAIATENNLSETAFFVRTGASSFDLRWFTPAAEVDLCGHATLASAHVLFEHMRFDGPGIHFDTRSGRLSVERNGDSLTMDFPALSNAPLDLPELEAIVGMKPEAVFSGQDLVVVLPDEDSVRELLFDPQRLRALPCRGVAFTAPGKDCDFVSRAFYPKLDIPEDPVTGSVHCQLVPYWVDRLDKPRVQARQISRRGGELDCELIGDRVRLGGCAVTFMLGQLCLPNGL